MADRNIAANVLIPSRTILTPGTALLVKGQHVEIWATADDFAEATLRLIDVAPHNV